MLVLPAKGLQAVLADRHFRQEEHRAVAVAPAHLDKMVVKQPSMAVQAQRAEMVSNLIFRGLLHTMQVAAVLAAISTEPAGQVLAPEAWAAAAPVA